MQTSRYELPMPPGMGFEHDGVEYVIPSDCMRGACVAVLRDSIRAHRLEVYRQQQAHVQALKDADKTVPKVDLDLAESARKEIDKGISVYDLVAALREPRHVAKFLEMSLEISQETAEDIANNYRHFPVLTECIEHASGWRGELKNLHSRRVRRDQPSPSPTTATTTSKSTES